MPEPQNFENGNEKPCGEAEEHFAEGKEHFSPSQLNAPPFLRMVFHFCARNFVALAPRVRTILFNILLFSQFIFRHQKKISVAPSGSASLSESTSDYDSDSYVFLPTSCSLEGLTRRAITSLCIACNVDRTDSSGPAELNFHHAIKEIAEALLHESVSKRNIG